MSTVARFRDAQLSTGPSSAPSAPEVRYVAYVLLAEFSTGPGIKSRAAAS
jgi:hypothetical protein